MSPQSRSPSSSRTRSSRDPPKRRRNELGNSRKDKELKEDLDEGVKESEAKVQDQRSRRSQAVVLEEKKNQEGKGRMSDGWMDGNELSSTSSLLLCPKLKKDGRTIFFVEVQPLRRRVLVVVVAEDMGFAEGRKTRLARE